jgi:hypothetical protein
LLTRAVQRASRGRPKDRAAPEPGSRDRAGARRHRGAPAVRLRIFLHEGARIGFSTRDIASGTGSDDEHLRDVEALAERATREVLPSLDSGWSALADQLGALTAVYDALDDLCTPRRRRFDPRAIAQMRLRLAEMGRALAERPVSGQWRLERDTVDVPGVGVVHQVARFDAGAVGPSARAVGAARALRDFGLASASCRGGTDELPLVALVVEPEPTRLVFVGFYFPEELVCDAGGSSSATNHRSSRGKP